MEQAVDEVQGTVDSVAESVTDRVSPSNVSLTPSDTTDLELSLLDAAKVGDDARVQQLLDEGANVNGRGSDGATPMMVGGGCRSRRHHAASHRARRVRRCA